MSPKHDSCFLLPSQRAPAVARRFVATTLSRWGVAARFREAPLLTSELVTNAVMHAESSVVLSVALDLERVRVEVQDQSEHLPVMADIDAAREGGWGLHIVQRLSTRWGLEPCPGGKTVWCEIAASDARDAPPAYG